MKHPVYIVHVPFATGYNRRAFPWYSGEATNDKKEFDMQDLQAEL